MLLAYYYKIYLLFCVCRFVDHDEFKVAVDISLQL